MTLTKIASGKCEYSNQIETKRKKLEIKDEWREEPLLWQIRES